MARILITGATGFVGTHLVKEAISRGYEVYAGVRLSSNTEQLTKLGVRTVVLDFSDEESMRKSLMALPVFDHIIHNAGLTKAAKANDYFETNTYNTQRFINAVIKAESCANKFLFVSSLAAYGPGKPDCREAVKNSDTPHPVTYYGKSKLQAEKYLTSQSELPYIILRPTSVYGPGEKDLFQFISLINKGFEFYMGKNVQQLTFVYVKDLVRVMLDSLESPYKNQSYFVTDGNTYTNTQLAQIVKQTMGKKTISIKFPMPIVRLVAAISESVSKTTGSMSILNKDKLNELTATNWQCNISNLVADLAYKPEYPLEKGMQETISWYKEHKWI